MKARPYRKIKGGVEPCSAAEAELVAIHFPGPSNVIFLPVVQGNTTRDETGCWTWNGSTESPTIKPSIRTRGGDFLCHSWVSDGKVQFLGDCTHDLKNQTVDLLDVEDVLGE